MMENNRIGLFKEKMNCMETYTGLVVDPLHIREEDICIEDIAHHLSLTCRYSGACERFYSVGQHSIHVLGIVREEMEDTNKASSESIRITSLAALLHDASETYTNDMIRPFKYGFKELKELESRILGVIMKKYGAIGADWQLIKKADNIMLATEAKLLMKSKGKGWELPEPSLPWKDIPAWTNEAVENMLKAYFKTCSTED